MINSDMSLWDDALNPKVRRNTSADDLTVVDLTGVQCGHQTSRLLASRPEDARAMIAKLRQVCDEWEVLVDAIDAEAIAPTAETVGV